MATAISTELQEIATSVSSDLGGILDTSSLRWMRDPTDHMVPDAVMALQIDGTSGRDNAVLLVSNAQFPDALADAVARAETLTQTLDARTAAKVHLPLARGTHQGQSYGLFARLTPMSNNKLMRQAQKTIAAPRIAHWLLDVARQTRQNVQDEASKDALFRAPLTYMAQDSDLPDPVTAAAQSWLERLDQPDTPLFTTAEHGDFWIGNVLFDPTLLPGVTSGFRVIDWGGMRMKGYAGIDLLRYCNSCFRPGARQTQSLLTSYMEGLGIAGPVGSLYPIAAMGQLGLNLDQFPKPRYLELVDRVFDTLHRLGMTPQG